MIQSFIFRIHFCQSPMWPPVSGCPKFWYQHPSIFFLEIFILGTSMKLCLKVQSKFQGEILDFVKTFLFEVAHKITPLISNVIIVIIKSIQPQFVLFGKYKSYTFLNDKLVDTLLCRKAKMSIFHFFWYFCCLEKHCYCEVLTPLAEVKVKRRPLKDTLLGHTCPF